MTMVLDLEDEQVDLGRLQQVTALDRMFPQFGLLSCLKVNLGWQGASAALTAAAKLADMRDQVDISVDEVVVATCGGRAEVLTPSDAEWLGVAHGTTGTLEVDAIYWTFRTEQFTRVVMSRGLTPGVWHLSGMPVRSLWVGWLENATRLFSVVAVGGQRWKVTNAP